MRKLGGSVFQGEKGKALGSLFYVFHPIHPPNIGGGILSTLFPKIARYRLINERDE